LLAVVVVVVVVLQTVLSSGMSMCRSHKAHDRSHEERAGTPTGSLSSAARAWPWWWKVMLLSTLSVHDPVL
jgi:hypothetical protein